MNNNWNNPNEIEDFNSPPSEPQTAPRDEAYLLDLFIGKNSDSFVDIYNKTNSGNRYNWFGWAGVNIVAGLFAYPWFFYRKLYLEGAALILVPVMISFVFPEFMSKVQTGFGALLMFFSNQYYTQQSLKKVKAIEALEIPLEERDVLLKSKGGVSLFGGILGTIIFCSLIGLFFLDATQKNTLPACDAELTKNLVRSSILENLRKRNVSTEKVVFDNFIAIEGETDDRHRCKVFLRTDKSAKTMRYTVEWENKENGRFRVNFKPTR